MNHTEKRNLIIINLFVLLLTIPFVGKAVHLDDTAFVYMAKQILDDPLRPHSFIFPWASKEGLATHVLDTPLVSYYLAFFIKLFGETVVVMHSAIILFSLIAANFMYFLSKRFLKEGLFPTLLLIATPIFLVMSHMLMLDLPLLAFFLAAVLFFVYGIDKNNKIFLILAGISAGLAYMTKPTAVVLLPLLALYAILKKSYKSLYVLIIPLAVMVLWAIHNIIFYNTVLFLEYLPWVQGRVPNFTEGMAALFFANLNYIGGATIFTMFLVYPWVRDKKKILLFLAIFILMAIPSYMLYNLSAGFISGQYNFIQLFLFNLFSSASIFFIFNVILYYIKNITRDGLVDNTFLLAWFFGLFILNITIAGGAARYNTIFLPVMIIFYFKMIDEFKIKKLEKKNIYSAALAFTLILGLFVAYADYKYAGSYRDFSDSVKEKYFSGDRTIWYVGHWGFQYYNDRNDYKVLGVNSNEPKQGDIIIKANIPAPRKISEQLKNRLELKEQVHYNWHVPIRIQNNRAHAGFYTYGGGFLPYSFSAAPLEEFEIYEVVK